TLTAGIVSSPQGLEPEMSSAREDDGSGEVVTCSVWNTGGICEARIVATHLTRNVATAVSTFRYWRMPIWILLLGASPLPAVWLLNCWRSYVSKRCGRGRACGYELRATTERCPECGPVH